jgi:hypothetical protein
MAIIAAIVAAPREAVPTIDGVQCNTSEYGVIHASASSTSSPGHCS